MARAQLVSPLANSFARPSWLVRARWRHFVGRRSSPRMPLVERASERRAFFRSLARRFPTAAATPPTRRRRQTILISVQVGNRFGRRPLDEHPPAAIIIIGAGRPNERPGSRARSSMRAALRFGRGFGQRRRWHRCSCFSARRLLLLLPANKRRPVDWRLVCAELLLSRAQAKVAQSRRQTSCNFFWPIALAWRRLF